MKKLVGTHDHLLLIKLQRQQEQLDLQITGSMDRFLIDESELEEDLAQEEPQDVPLTPIQLTLRGIGIPTLPRSPGHTT